MPVLKNPKHELYAQGLAKGQKREVAYTAAGYKFDAAAASRLSNKVNISDRVKELQTKAAEKAVVTIESVTLELQEARAMALSLGQPGAAVAASMGKAKINGLIVDKKDHSSTDGTMTPKEISVKGLSDSALRELAALKVEDEDHD